MSVSDVEVTVTMSTRLLSAASFGDASLPVPLLELRATCAFYIGFGCQQGHKREQEHYRQLIEERRSDDGKIVSKPCSLLTSSLLTLPLCMNVELQTAILIQIKENRSLLAFKSCVLLFNRTKRFRCAQFTSQRISSCIKFANWVSFSLLSCT